MKLKDIGITPLIEMTSGGSTSAGSIAGVASSIFTPTSDGTIRRTKKKKKDPSIYEEPDQQVAQKATSLKTVGGGQASGAMVAKGLDKVSQGGTMPSNLVKAIAPYAQAIQKMMADPKLFARFKMLMKQANAGDAGAPVGRKLGESLTRQHFEMFADVLRDVADPDKRQEHADFLIQVFTMDNPRFDISRFLKASGLTERKLSGTEKKNKEHNVKKLKKHKDNFAKYGNDAESVMYAVATKSAKKGKKYS